MRNPAACRGAWRGRSALGSAPHRTESLREPWPSREAHTAGTASLHSTDMTAGRRTFPRSAACARRCASRSRAAETRTRAKRERQREAPAARARPAIGPCTDRSHKFLQRRRSDDAGRALGFRASRRKLKRSARSGEREREAARERARLRGSPSANISSAGLNARRGWRLRRALPLAARERRRNASTSAQAHAPLHAAGRKRPFIAEWPGQRAEDNTPRARLACDLRRRCGGGLCAAPEQVIANGSANGKRRSRSDGDDRFCWEQPDAW